MGLSLLITPTLYQTQMKIICITGIIQVKKKLLVYLNPMLALVFSLFGL